MSLRTIHVVYSCGVITIAVLLILANTTIHHCAAVIVLLVAVPWFRVVKRAMNDAILTAIENRNHARASLKEHREEETPNPDRSGTQIEALR